MRQRISKSPGRLAAGLVLTALFVSLLAGPAGAQAVSTLTRVTTGSQAIVNQNIPAARNKAVGRALEIAVQDAVAQLVTPQTFAANLEFLYDQILPKSREYLVTYRVLGGVEHKGQYRVGVESTIHLGLLEKTLTDARILHAGTDKPRLLFLVAEQTPDSLLPRYWWGKNPEPYISQAESALALALMDQRFPLVGQGEERPDPALYQVEFPTIYDVPAALALAKALGADMVILGRAQVAEAMNRMGDEKAFDAQINLEIYDTASGKSLGTTQTRSAAKSDLEQEGSVLAMTQAADQAAVELAARLDEFWNQNLRKENRFEVSIQGENFLPRYIALKKRFREMQDIENFQPKELGADQALLEMVYKGRPRLFADTVLLKTFEGFGLEVEVVSDTRVDIRFIEEADLEAAPEENPAQAPGEISPQGEAAEVPAVIPPENPKKEAETP